MQEAGCRKQTWAVVVALALLALASGGVHAQGGTGVRVHLEDAAGAPVAGAEVRFFYEAGTAVGGCTTGEDGGCEIFLENPPQGLIRGYLEVAGAGKRSLIWPGGWVDVPLRLKADGSLEVATETIGGEPTPAAPAPGAGGVPGGPAAGAATPAVSGGGLPDTPAAESAVATAMPPAVAGTAGSAAAAGPTAPPADSSQSGPAHPGELRPSAPPLVPLALTVLGVGLLAWGVWQWRKGSRS